MNKTLSRFFNLTYFLVFLRSENVECCFEERPDHTMTEAPMKPLLKVGKSCPIPERKTTKLKNAKFITKCQFASINYQTLGDESILLPTGDVLPKESCCYNFLQKTRETLFFNLISLLVEIWQIFQMGWCSLEEKHVWNQEPLGIHVLLGEYAILCR